MRFENQTVIVTGASSGIGLATARLFEKEGAKVVLFARSGTKLAELTSRSESMTAVEGDVRKPEDIDRLFRQCQENWGSPAILVNNAGTITPSNVADMSVETWDEQFETNVRGAFLCIRRAVPLMERDGGGSIVNVGSISGVSGPTKFGGFSAYAASKAALIMLTEALAPELAPAGIRINCVNPGSVDTPMWDSVSGGSRADMKPEEVASTIAFLCSPESRPINGQNVNVFSS